MIELNQSELEQNIKRWLAEDVGSGDITTMATISSDHHSKGIIHIKESGIIAGLPVAAAVFRVVDAALNFSPKITDGEWALKGTVIAEVEGKTRSILTGERLALNIMQRLSGIATKTKRFVDAAGDLSVRIVDTRKTTPGHRSLEKYAVRVGGGFNHRFGLYDAVMIKDNHIQASGGIVSAVEAARSNIPHTMKIEVEAENFQQVKDAVEANADIILLDNMKPSAMVDIVSYIKKTAPHVIVEASGSVSLETIKEIALTGVDVISAGSLTYSVNALDISLDLNTRKEERL